MRFHNISIFCGLTLIVLVTITVVKWYTTDVFSNIGYNFMQPLDSVEPEELVFHSYDNSSISVPGKPFNPNLLHFLSKYGLTAQNESQVAGIKSEDVVFVTYASSNHFFESRAGIFQLRKLLPNKIIYYDLGLKPAQASDIKSFCNLEFRKLKFDQYPRHVRNLKNYAFKAIIEAEVYSEFPVFWMIDSSVRIKNELFLLEFYDEIRQASTEKFVLPHLSAGHSTFAVTHPGMFDYLSMNKNESKAIQAGSTSFIVRSDFSREAVKWNFLCAMTENCIAPKGSTTKCRFGKDRMSEYANCHRYDQSAINIILSSLRRKYNVVPYSEIQLQHRFIWVQRLDNYNGSLRAVCENSGY